MADPEEIYVQSRARSALIWTILTVLCGVAALALFVVAMIWTRFENTDGFWLSTVLLIFASNRCAKYRHEARIDMLDIVRKPPSRPADRPGPRLVKDHPDA